MTEAEMVLWAHALSRAWRGARSQESREFFNEWYEELTVAWRNVKWERYASIRI